MRIFIFIFFSCFCLSKGISQQLHSHQLNLENGLPSNQTYSVVQDTKGFIWICTDHGVVRYDGEEFELFSTLNGLLENTVFRIYQDYKGRLWFLGMSGTLCYWDGVAIIPHVANAQIQSTQRNHSAVMNLAIDSNETIYFRGTDRIGYYMVGVEDTTIYYVPLKLSDQSSLLVINETASLLINAWKDPKIVDWKGPFKEHKLPLVKLPIDSHIQREYQVGGNQEQFFFREDSFYKFNPYTNSFTLFSLEIKNKGIYSAYLDRKGHLWVSYRGGGLYYYGTAPFDRKPKCFFSDINIASIYEDQEGNYWVATLDQGVFLIGNWELFHFFKNKGPIHKLLVDEDHVFAIGKRVLHRLYNGFPFETKVHSTKSRQDFFDIKKWKNSYIFSNGVIAEFEEEQLSFVYNRVEPMQSGKVIYVDEENDQILIGAGKGLLILKNDTIKCFTKDHWINAIEKISTDEWFLGTTKGLYYYNQRSNKMLNVDTTSFLFSQRILSLNYFQGYLLVGTRGYGVLLVDTSSYKVVKQWNSLNELSSVFIHCVQVENDSIVWVGTNQGANRLVVFEGEIKESITLNRQNFLPSNGVNDILIQDSVIWLATDNGVVHLPQQIFTSVDTLADLPIYLKSIVINGKAFPLKKSYDLAYNEQNIVINFLALSFNFSNAVTYRYQLKKRNEKEVNWNYTQLPQINFNNLAADDYILRMEVRGKEGVWQKKGLDISFQIRSHFTQTWTFFFAILSILSLILGIYLRSILTKKNLEKELAEAEQKALRSQMNPHFLFNAINSVFYFLYKNKKKEALDFLQKFAALMRSTLENTQHALISLEEDLEHLKLYIDMEQERLSSGSVYQHEFGLSLAANLNLKEWEIPPMLIQPLVENAIIHGLAPKEGMRKLKVHIEEFNTGLQIRVEDNGIGRSAAEELKKQFFIKKTSQGLNLLQQRIRTINQLLHTKMKTKVEDVSDDPDCITRYTIYLPLKLKKKYHA